MTVSAWIESLQRFDGALPVIIRVQGEDALLIAESPSFSVDAGCTETEALCIDMTNEDEGVEMTPDYGPRGRCGGGIE